MVRLMIVFALACVQLLALATANYDGAVAGPNGKSADHALIRALLGSRFRDALKALSQGADPNAAEGGV